MRGIISGLVALLCATSASVAAAQQTDVIRGRVTGPDSLPVQGVEVRATSYQGAVMKSATTDRNGRYTIVFLNGEGDYWMEFRKLGLAMRRFEIKRIGDEEILIADTRMSSTIAQLDAVSVTAQRDRALPNRNSNPDVGGGERPLVNGLNVAADQAGNIAAMAAAVAGLQLIPGFDGAPDMFSVLGLTGDQNSTTFNGLGSAISALPPDVLATTSIVPYTFDPALGGFSGAQVVIRTLPGTNFSRRSVSSTEILPPLQWADAIAVAQGQKYTSARLGGNAAGPIVIDRFFYNGAYNVQRRFTDARTLVNTAPLGLSAVGIAPDSAARLRDLLTTAGIPVGGSTPGLAAQNSYQVVTNFDLLPSASGSGHSFVIGAGGNYQSTAPVSRGGLMLAMPSHAGETTLWSGNATVIHSNYFGFGILTKTTLGVARSGQNAEPYLSLPEGIVRVTSALGDASSSVKPLYFGGSSARSSNRTSTIQALNLLSWFSADNRHTIKIATSLGYDAFASAASTSALGTYSYNSLADLEAALPAAFTRTTVPAAQSGAQLVGALSIGDYWRPTENLQVQYGVRADANRFLARPATNRAVSDAFGISNTFVPSEVALSPRIGMQWYYGKAPTVAYAPGAARPPRAVMHAGVGLFRNVGSAQLLGPALLATGLPGSAQNASCVGSAVPFPDWPRFLSDAASIPLHCADGSAGSTLGSASPNVTLFDRTFRQPRSVRAASDWSGPIFDNRLALGVQGVVSSGLSQAGFIDLNFDPTTRFALSDEANRPVFASPDAIVPATGSISAGASRRTTAFQRVTAERSDLRVDARQLTVNLRPVTASARFKWDLTYTLLDRYERVNGFASTAGNPLDRFWSPSTLGGRHTVVVSWYDFPLFDVAYLSASAAIASGQRYTPMIANDVNGDGFANDRAFVFDPASASDPGLVSGMQALLDHGTPSARYCLARQLNALASRGSCQAPWTTNGRLQLRFNPQKIGLPKRLTMLLDLQNPLALADLAIHGSNELHGWGQNLPPDQNLLYVRSFDPATQRFRYEINQRFGSTRPQDASSRALSYLSLSFGLDIGRPRERQLLTQRLDLGRGHPGNRQDAMSMKLLGTTTIPNPMNMILQQQESLGLTRIQADSLATLSYRFSLFTDSVWTPTSTYLASLPDEYDTGLAYGRYVAARERSIDFLLTLVPAAKDVLTSAQRRRLPPQIANYLDERVLRFLRSSSAGDGTAAAARP